MVALDGETPSLLVVAIEPILGTVKYEARSHYYQVLEDVVTYQESVYVCQRDHDGHMFQFKEVGSDKISTTLVESGLVKTRIGRTRQQASLSFLSGKPHVRMKFPLLIMSVGPLCILIQ